MARQFLAFVICAFIGSVTSAADFLQTIPLPGNECLGSVAVMRSGDILGAGADYSSSDILLMRFNSSGTVLRTQRISGTANDEAQVVLGTSDGGAVLIGSTTSFGAGNSDAFILKLRSNGTIAFKRYFGTSGNEHFVRVAQTRDNGFLLLGDADHDPNLNDIVVTKFNRSGRMIWRKVISGGDFDHASDLALTSDNGAIVAFAADFPDGVRSILAKFSASGSIQWSRIYGSSGNHVAVSAFQASDGGYYFTELFASSGAQKSGTVLSKLDSAGLPVWSRIYRSPGVHLNASVSSIETGERLLLAGNTTSSSASSSRGVLFSVDQNGNILWRKRVRPDSRPVFVGRPHISRADQSILVSGCVGLQSSGNMDSILLRMNGNGQIQGGCSKLTTFPVSNSPFNLNSSAITLEEIPVPFLSGTANFQVATVAADELEVCSGD